MIVVFQGSWDEHCSITFLESILKWHKGDVIFSTWKNNKPPVLPKFNYLFLDDPGKGPVQNLYRQIKGLRAALNYIDDKEVVLKLRSDMFCYKNPGDFYPLEQCKDVFSTKIGISLTMTRDPIRFPYFISDWMWYGYAKDLKKLSNIEISNNNIDYTLGAEYNWQFLLKKKYSSANNALDFLHDNYNIMRLSTLNAGCGKYIDQPEDHPFYIKI